MNVYDFDKTIYAGDSSVDFYLYCLVRQPRIALCCFRQIRALLLHAARRIDTTTMKEEFFSFLSKLHDPQALVCAFWARRYRAIKPWYLQGKRATDVIISASPSFLLEPICQRLGIQAPIATQMDACTGKIHGRNCKGAEKVHRFRQLYPDAQIDRFYSDSRADSPLAKLALEAFWVSGDRLSPWQPRENTPE